METKCVSPNSNARGTGRGADENKPPPLSDKQRIARSKSRSVELWKKNKPRVRHRYATPIRVRRVPGADARKAGNSRSTAIKKAFKHPPRENRHERLRRSGGEGADNFKSIGGGGGAGDGFGERGESELESELGGRGRAGRGAGGTNVMRFLDSKGITLLGRLLYRRFY